MRGVGDGAAGGHRIGVREAQLLFRNCRTRPPRRCSGMIRAAPPRRPDIGWRSPTPWPAGRASICCSMRARTLWWGRRWMMPASPHGRSGTNTTSGGRSRRSMIATPGTRISPPAIRLWSSLISTPPHPDYVAGHPAFSGAAATVLASFFGTDNIAFELHLRCLLQQRRPHHEPVWHRHRMHAERHPVFGQHPRHPRMQQCADRVWRVCRDQPELQQEPPDLPDHRGLQQLFAGLVRLSGRRVQPGGRRHPYAPGGGECAGARRCGR